MARSMDLAVENDMVNGLFFCATLTSLGKGHTTFVQAGAETSDTAAEPVKPDPRVLGRAILGEWVPVSGMKVRIFVLLPNHSALHR